MCSSLSINIIHKCWKAHEEEEKGGGEQEIHPNPIPTKAENEEAKMLALLRMRG